jgi:hypothetical protein
MKYLMILLLFLCSSVYSQYIDLKGSDVLGKQLCTKDNKRYVCVVVEKDKKKYLVLLDEKGEYEIWSEEKLLWARNMV